MLLNSRFTCDCNVILFAVCQVPSIENAVISTIESHIGLQESLEIICNSGFFLDDQGSSSITIFCISAGAFSTTINGPATRVPFQCSPGRPQSKYLNVNFSIIYRQYAINNALFFINIVIPITIKASQVIEMHFNTTFVYGLPTCASICKFYSLLTLYISLMSATFSDAKICLRFYGAQKDWVKKIWAKILKQKIKEEAISSKIYVCFFK